MGYPDTFLTKPMRRAIMCGFIFLFFLITPMVILYTAGYRYDWKNKEVRETGVISIDVYPRDVRVLLNKVVTERRMPLRLTNRAPGTYHLAIQKNGYKTWEKDITVTSRQTTYIKSVTLFREAEPTPVASGTMAGAETLAVSQDGAYLLVSSSGPAVSNIELIATETGKRTVIKKGASLEEAPRLLWSPWNNTALIVTSPAGGGVTLDLLDADEERVVASRVLAGNTDPIFQWDKNGVGIFLEEPSASGSSVIVHLDESGAFQAFAIPTDVTAWYVAENDDLWTWSADDHGVRQNGGAPLAITNFFMEKFIDVNSRRVIVKTPAHMVSLKLPSGETQTFLTERYAYNKNTGEWLAWSGSELWSIYESGDAVLLDRRQEEIRTVEPLDEYGLLLIATPRALYGFNPGYAVGHELARVEDLWDVGVDERQKKIYFLGTVRGKKGVYSLSY